ncbi:MAG: hypothetical protein AAGE18_06145 [Pseudomonadota bacterium]
MRVIAALFLAGLTAAPLPVAADETIRILPDQAVLACHSRAQQAVRELDGNDPVPVQRYDNAPMENFMFTVKGKLAAEIEGEVREIEVSCDVSSNGIEVFSMVVGDTMSEMPAEPAPMPEE